MCAVQRVMPADSVSVHRNLHAACWCCAFWHGKPRQKATITRLHCLACKWCIYRNMLFNPVNSWCTENKVFVRNHCCLAWRHWQAVHVCSLLSTSWSHTQASTTLQAGKPVASVTMKRLYITSWSYCSACLVYWAAQCQPLWGSLTTHTPSGLSSRPAILDSNSTVLLIFLSVGTSAQVINSDTAWPFHMAWSQTIKYCQSIYQ